MKTTYQIRSFNATLILLLYLVLGVYSCVAQSFQRITHNGIEATVGIHGFREVVTGDQVRMRALTRGAAIGFVTGNNLVRARIRPFGMYRSADVDGRAFDILKSEAVMNLYPLEFLRTRKHVLDIYLSTGVSFDKFRYRDRNIFVQNDGLTTQNDFQTIDKVTVINQVSGIGVEYHLPFSFLHVFSEVAFANSIYSSSRNTVFRETLRQSTPMINFGLRIGTKKAVKNSRVYPG